MGLKRPNRLPQAGCPLLQWEHRHAYECSGRAGSACCSAQAGLAAPAAQSAQNPAQIQHTLLRLPSTVGAWPNEGCPLVAVGPTSSPFQYLQKQVSLFRSAHCAYRDIPIVAETTPAVGFTREFPLGGGGGGGNPLAHPPNWTSPQVSELPQPKIDIYLCTPETWLAAVQRKVARLFRTLGGHLYPRCTFLVLFHSTGVATDPCATRADLC